MLLQLSQFFPLCLPPPDTPIFSSNPHLSSCPWVMHVSSLPLYYLYCSLHPPVYFVFTNLSFLIPAPFPHSPASPLSTDNPPNVLHICDSVPVLLVCSVCYLNSIIDSCEFIAILMFIILIFFFLNKLAFHVIMAW